MRIIEPKSAITLAVNKGQILRVVDPEGCQVADFVCFSSIDYNEFFSQAKTRSNNNKVRISVKDSLFSNRNNILFTIIDDKVGVHDLMFPPCNRYIYEHILKVGPRNGCLENLSKALEPHGIGKDFIPDPFNIFMHTSIDDNHNMVIHRALSKPGDYIDLKAQMDCLVGISACAEDVSECNGGICTTIGIEIY